MSSRDPARRVCHAVFGPQRAAAGVRRAAGGAAGGAARRALRRRRAGRWVRSEDVCGRVYHVRHMCVCVYIV